MINRVCVAVAGLVAFVSPVSSALAADHLDSPAVKMDPAADSNDLYSFVDGGDLIVAMSTSRIVPPIDPHSRLFASHIRVQPSRITRIVIPRQRNMAIAAAPDATIGSHAAAPLAKCSPSQRTTPKKITTRNGDR